jgi:2-dehydro-3-deoxyphosphogluconate aldolase/(4S)-4-hydroxy-2-oxoglutarate aldolase
VTTPETLDAAAFRAALTEHRLVAVIRSQNPADAKGRADAAIAAGVGIVEVAWTTPEAASVVRHLGGKAPLLGAGTIVRPDQAEEAVSAGAQFLIAPDYSAAVAEEARALGVLYIPGVMTPRDVADAAIHGGHQILKLFPAGSLGPAHFRALRDPFPGLAWVPTGGVDWMNAAEWLEAGAAGVGLGTALFDTVDLRSALAHLKEAAVS